MIYGDFNFMRQRFHNVVEMLLQPYIVSWEGLWYNVHVDNIAWEVY